MCWKVPLPVRSGLGMSNCDKLCSWKGPRLAVTNLGHINLLGQVNVLNRTCLACPKSIDHLSARARYCDSKCRKRAEVLKRDPTARRAKQQARQATKRAGRRCAKCSASIAHRPLHAKYCSRACLKKTELQRDREIRRQYTRVWLANNPDYGTNWRRNNKEKSRAIARRSYQKNKANYRASNLAWEARNPGAHTERSALRRARFLGNPGSVGVSERDWFRLIRRYRGGCAYCGNLAARIEMDHIVPLSRGGRHAIGNVLPACQECNRSKKAMLLVVWKSRRKELGYHGRSRTSSEGCPITGSRNCPA